jgi:hypothetical protein
MFTEPFRKIYRSLTLNSREPATFGSIGGCISNSIVIYLGAGLALFVASSRQTLKVTDPILQKRINNLLPVGNTICPSSNLTEKALGARPYDWM